MTARELINRIIVESRNSVKQESRNMKKTMVEELSETLSLYSTVCPRDDLMFDALALFRRSTTTTISPTAIPNMLKLLYKNADYCAEPTRKAVYLVFILAAKAMAEKSFLEVPVLFLLFRKMTVLAHDKIKEESNG